VEDKGVGVITLFGHIPVQKEKYYIMRIKKWLFGKSIVALIYRELLVLSRKIDIFKLIYRYLLVFGR
jgi:hypothetical protein